MAQRPHSITKAKPGFIYHTARGEPPDKKRRTDSDVQNPPENPGDDLWDDDLDLMTQDQLKDIDDAISMSQQVVDRNHNRHSSSNRMVGRGTGRSHSAGNVLSNTNQKTHQHSDENIQKITTNKDVAKTARFPQTASTSATRPSIPFDNLSEAKCSTSKPFGSYTPREQSATNRFVCPTKPSCGSIKSQLTPQTGATGSGQFSPALPSTQAGTDFVDITQQQIAKLQKELTSVKEENEKMKNLSCQKEGEVHMLRNLLQETKQELSNVKQEQIKMRDQHRMEQNEKEKNLAQNIEKLKTQMQFTECERDELKTRCKVLEKRSSVSAGASDGPNSPVLSETQSPRRKRNTDMQSPMTPKGNFPNRVSFMAGEAASTKSPKRKPESEVATARSSGSDQLTNRELQKKFTLDVPNRRGRISGPMLVSLMLPKSAGGVTSEQGIIGLLQMQQNKQDSQNHSSLKDQDTNSITTNTCRWIQNLHQQPSLPDSEQPTTLVVPQNYYSLAVHAIKSLLQTESVVYSTDLLQGQTEEAIFLLPAIESYLSHYLDLVRSVREPSPSVASSVTSFSSPLDSYDSVSSYQRSLARQSATYTNQVEQWALNALHILHVLVDFSPHVRLALFGVTEQVRGRCRTNNDGQVPTEDQMSADEESSDESLATSHSSLTSSISASSIARKCRVLEELMRTANPVLPNGKIVSTDIIEVCLQILTILATQTSTDRLPRFETLLRQDALLVCLVEDLAGTAEQRLRCHLEVLNLVKALTRSSDILPKLCSATEDCLLSAMYTLVLSPPQGASSDYRIKFGLKLIQLLSSAFSHHLSGMATILEADCSCGCDVVKTVTQLLYHGLHEYRAAPSALCLSLLHQGAVLLCSLAQCGRQFVQHRREIENQYIEVVIGLYVIFKESQDNSDHDDVIQTLWDFDVEYAQDTDDSEEVMDAT